MINKLFYNNNKNNSNKNKNKKWNNKINDWFVFLNFAIMDKWTLK